MAEIRAATGPNRMRALASHGMVPAGSRGRGVLDFAYHFIFLGALLVLLSILAGLFSARIGAPLLLVFLGLGMLAGEDGPGGILFSNFHLTYEVGAVALAVVLFDGGLRTSMSAVRLASGPAISLATLGVVITAGIAGLAAHYALGIPWIYGLLVGAIIGSTDAAAVFLLLHQRGTEISRRVTATLEIESGVNDPMAIFLTVALVEYLIRSGAQSVLAIGADLLIQLLGGAAIGVVGGFALLWLINRVVLAAGLYPILAMAGAMLIVSGSHFVHASGFMAVYVAGLVLGNRRHRAHQVISRFFDGLAWLAQIVMFLVLGLLVTPSDLVPHAAGALIVTAVLIVVARPMAVWICLLPFRFIWQEVAFISWVGLRGAVPIFLACIPVLAGIDGAEVFFNVAFVVVIASLIVQGWTVAPAARALGLEVPPRPEVVERGDIDMPTTADRDAGSWRVDEDSPALDYAFDHLPLPRRTRIIAVIRDGTLLNRGTLERLAPDDTVIAVVPPEQMLALDSLFARRPRPRGSTPLGEFMLDAGATLGEVAAVYDIPVDPADRDQKVGGYVTAKLGRTAVVGDRIEIGPVELVVAEIGRSGVTRIGLEVIPQREQLLLFRLVDRMRRRLRGS